MRVASNDYSLVSPPLPPLQTEFDDEDYDGDGRSEEVKKRWKRRQRKRRKFKIKTISKIGWRPRESMSLPQGIFY